MAPSPARRPAARHRASAANEALAGSAPTGKPGREPYNHERWLIAKMMRVAGHPPVRFRLWNDDVVEPEGREARFTLWLMDPRALYALVANPNLAFRDLYISGQLVVEGDLAQLTETLCQSIRTARQRWPRWLGALWRTQSQRPGHVDGERASLDHHASPGSQFYELWLDQAAMQFTCAYYERPENSLEQAQLAKLEHICRKLRLKPGMSVVEAGGGWGGLSRYMARHYGARVYAYNRSREQIHYARAEARKQGLDHLITYVNDDYLNIHGHYDAFVSVGLLEQLGQNHYAQLSDLIKCCLNPRGLALLHSIGRNRPMAMNTWIEDRIFSGACPPSIGQFIEICEHNDFSVLDVENLRLHYAQTLGHWLERFDRHRETITAMYNEQVTRSWQLYLAGLIAGFRSGSLQLFQVVFSHSNNNDIPYSRQDLYVFPATPEGL